MPLKTRGGLGVLEFQMKNHRHIGRGPVIFGQPIFPIPILITIFCPIYRFLGLPICRYCMQSAQERAQKPIVPNYHPKVSTDISDNIFAQDLGLHTTRIFLEMILLSWKRSPRISFDMKANIPVRIYELNVMINDSTTTVLVLPIIGAKLREMLRKFMQDSFTIKP